MFLPAINYPMLDGIMGEISADLFIFFCNSSQFLSQYSEQNNYFRMSLLDVWAERTVIKLLEKSPI
jgi:hypothetical protein